MIFSQLLRIFDIAIASKATEVQAARRWRKPYRRFNNLTQLFKEIFKFVIMKNYNRITFKERIEIEKLLALNNSYSAIAIKLGRHKTSIAREVKKYTKKQYMAYEANIASYKKSIDRKFGKSKVLLNPKLQDYIHKKLA